MKSVTNILAVCFVFCLNSCSQDFKKLKESDVEPAKVQIAQDFSEKYLTKLKNGSFYSFQDEAVEIIKNSLTEEKQKSGYQYLKDNFGDYQSLEYAETWTQAGNSSIIVIRFKSDFDKSNKKLEVRVVLDESDKIAGFWIKPWSDILK